MKAIATSIVHAGILLMSLCACALGAPQSEPVTAPYAGASIAEWKGKVDLELPGATVSSPFRGQVLPPGTTIISNEGRVLLKLMDESQVVVRPHTRLVLSQPSAGSWQYFQLLLGRIRVQVKKRLTGAPSFQIGTPSAVISVRGTAFSVEVDSRHVTEVDVFDGMVEVRRARGGGEAVILEPGYASRVGFDSDPEPPHRIEDFRPEVDRDFNNDSQEDHKDDLKHSSGQSSLGESDSRNPAGLHDDNRDNNRDDAPDLPHSNPDQEGASDPHSSQSMRWMHSPTRFRSSVASGCSRTSCNGLQVT